jgi:hypothetical protein
MARCLSLAVAVCAAFLSLAESATAATPCWKNVLTDSYDGRLDRTYPVRCYRVALQNVPADIDAYTSASDSIRQALLAALKPGSGSAKPAPTTRPAATRRIAVSAGTSPVEALAAETETPPAKAVSPFVVLGIAAGALTVAASAKLLGQRRHSEPARSTRTVS